MATVDLSHISYYVVALLADGSQLNLEPVAESIAWEENEKELAVRLNLKLRDIEYGGSQLASRISLCTLIYLYADWGAGRQEIFRGTVWEWSYPQIAGESITLTVYDNLFYLQKSTDSKYYAKGKTTKAIIEDICASWSITLGEYTAPDLAHQKILYKSKKISAMLLETLEDAKKLGGEQSVIRAAKGRMDVLKRGSNEDVYSFKADLNLIKTNDKYSMTNLVTRVLVLGKDDSKGRPKVEATVDGSTEYGILQSVISKGSTSLSEAKTEANELLEEKGKPTRTITLQAPDLPFLRKGDRIHVDMEGLSGYFYIKGVSHNATNGTMQMEVEPV